MSRLSRKLAVFIKEHKEEGLAKLPPEILLDEANKRGNIEETFHVGVGFGTALIINTLEEFLREEEDNTPV